MQQGEENLEIISKLDRFNDWMFDEIHDYVKGNILEVGSGIGTISARILRKKDVEKVILTDVSNIYISRLKKKFNDKNTKVTKLDLGNLNDFKKLKKDSFDTIVCLNVLEHVKEDLLAIKNMKSLLKKNGKLILLVPAYKFLYNELDMAVLHYRRYSKKDLVNLSKKSDFNIKKMFYFNFVSIFGWFINGGLLGKREVNETAAGFLNKFIPVVKFIEKYIIFRKMGLSLIAIYEK